MKFSRTVSIVFLPVLAAATAHAQAPAPPGFYAAEPVLRDFVEQALQANPGLAEAEARYRAALERVPQAVSLPDPMVTFTQMLRGVETRVGPQVNAVMLSQAFPWFGKLDLRGQVAVQDAAALSQLLRAKQRDVIAAVKAAFYDLGYVDRALQITEEERSLLEHYEHLAQDRYASGQGLQQAVIKIQAELTKIQNRLYTLWQQRASLAVRLNTAMDRAPEAPVPAVRLEAAPPLDPAALELDPLYALGQARRGEIGATDALIGRFEDAVALAKKNLWPDLVLGAGFLNVGRRHDPAGIAAPPPDNGKNAWTVSVGVSLPIRRGKLKAGVRQAGEELAAQQAARARQLNDIEADVRDQVIRLQTLDDQIRLFERVLIPQALEAQRSTEAAYQTGQLGVLDLLDSERILLDVRLANARQRADFLLALNGLERAVGEAFPTQSRVP